MDLSNLPSTFVRAAKLGALIVPLAAADPALSQTAATDARASTVIVFDASNSMWGQVEGRSKIEIAREVIGDMLEGWDPQVELGLVAYGHRRAGDCGDIELVIPVGPVEPGSFSKIVNGLVPRGKTPLTEAVREAAKILNYRDTNATVILVSDGIESCNANLCELAEELERGGVDFTAHVIGFDVGRIEDQRQLSCLADTTGGQFLTADTAGELLTALQTVAAPPPPLPPVLRLEAVAQSGGAVIDDQSLIWTVVALDREETVLGGETIAQPELEVAAGRYFARAELGNRAGSIEFDYAGDEDALHQVVLADIVSLEAPEEAETGTVVDVHWTGPDAAGDFIALAELGAAATEFIAYARTSAGSPAKLTMPDLPGDYELRYVDAAGGKVLADIPIRIVGSAATLESDPVVEAGAAFEVLWTGPDNKGDYVTIVPEGADDNTYKGFAYTSKGSPAGLNAPDQPGSYELRYISALSRSVLARLPVTVSEASATLEAAPTISAGADITITWTGPDNKGDFITIVPVGEEAGKYGKFAYTRDGSPAKLRAPDAPGNYELRYLTSQSLTTLASLPITVTEVPATLEAAPTIGAGADITVTWTGPDNKSDFITIVPVGEEAGKYAKFAYTRDGSPVKLRAPDVPGNYELRYLTGQSLTTLASLPITVDEVSATLEAAPTIDAGADIRVTWTGPDNKNDFITVVPVGDEDGKFGKYFYTRKGSPMKLQAPDQPGQYELRYLAGQTRATLASRPITVVEVAAELDASPTVDAGSEIRITWTGPDNKNDFITIVPTGEEEGKFGKYTYTRKGSPMTLRVPDTPGSYELRYITGQTRATLADLPITVTEVSAALEAAPTISAGAVIVVTWTGPDNKNDYITIVPDGADEGKIGKQAYTRKGSPAKLRVPDQPGNYELRYSAGQTRATLASLPVTVTEVTAELDAPPAIGAGSDIPVTWTGPDTKGDFITIVPVGEEEGKFGNFTYTRKGSPMKVQAPVDAGSYELRYLTGQSRATLTSLPIAVTEVTATLEAPPSAPTGGKVEVIWTGPSNKRDLIVIAEPDAAGSKWIAFAYTRKGSPVSVKVPKEAGNYELRYVTGQDYKVLARVPFTVH